MKRISTILSSFFLIALFVFSACAEAPDSDQAKVKDMKPVNEAKANLSTKVKEGKTIKTPKGVKIRQIDIKESSVGWIGTKPTGQHNGTFKLKSGIVKIENNAISGGNFVINVKSLSVDDLEGEMAANLRGHLMGEDFLKGNKYPTARFEITNIQPLTDVAKKSIKLVNATHTVAGNLQLLGKTKNIQFPAYLSVNGNSFEAKADFNINRTDWNIIYGNDKNLGDKFIRPEVNITLDIKG